MRVHSRLRLRPIGAARNHPTTRAGRTIRARRPAPSPARVLATAVTVFALIGLVSGSWAARIPDVASRVGATHASLGVALFCISAGALISMQTAGALCARWGAGRVTATGAALVSAGIALPAVAPSLGTLCAALLAFGAATGLVNVAANALGVRLQHGLGRPVMSTMHAGFSFGGLFGALSGGLVSAYLPVHWHLIAVAALGVGVALAIRPTLTRFADAADDPSGPADALDEPGADHGASARPVRAGGAGPVIVLLGMIAGCTAFAEGALTDWASLHLREDLHAVPALAAAGYAAFSLAMGVARLLGRRLILKYGDTAVLVVGGMLAALGMLTGALTPSPYAALAGFVLVGFGLANVFPLAIAKAGLLRGARGVARASTVGYGGLLGGPPIIGLVAGGLGLPGALTAVSVLAVLAAVLALVVDLRLHGEKSVAAALRAQARARLEPVAARIGSAAQSHGDSLYLLLDQDRTPVA